ncbi:DUF2484 family protein [Phaeovulum sp.]|uniref:DUF2484 family protein n=1 Tax=Phaeovulum sp. TaxID=2934796 RepID=UPI00272FD8D1|nr:DUF2484 family protein [Phaeovulum sp.]MDP1668439.1 DUF2484 family protein [Phaeovulum sp.]MDZ4118882.1 DUF2484 family protein [Phaeovulum sp.]
MSLVLILACVWVLAASATALLPLHRQMLPGLVLLVSAPVLLVWIGVVHGVWVVALGLAAFVSLFRRPLWYLAQRAMGRPVSPPYREGRE